MRCSKAEHEPALKRPMVEQENSVRRKERQKGTVVDPSHLTFIERGIRNEVGKDVGGYVSSIFDFVSQESQSSFNWQKINFLQVTS